MAIIDKILQQNVSDKLIHQFYCTVVTKIFHDDLSVNESHHRFIYYKNK